MCGWTKKWDPDFKTQVLKSLKTKWSTWYTEEQDKQEVD